MKKIIYIFTVLILISCNSRNESPISDETYNLEEADSEIEKVSIEPEENTDIDDLSLEIDIVPENSQYIELSQQKLQEMYDLLSLQKSRPEFSETINLQIKNYAIAIDKFSSSGDVKIQNLELINEAYPVADTVRKIKLHYDIVSGDKVKKDSVWAVITSSFVPFEGKNIISKKVKFSKIDN